jgi:hypothetical protein
MIAKRVLITGPNNAQMARQVAYTLELGAEVLHAGEVLLYSVNPPPLDPLVQVGHLPDIRSFEEGYPERADQQAQAPAAARQDVPAKYDVVPKPLSTAPFEQSKPA